MKRIGILTYFTDFPYFNDINPGMNLQAYSVLSSLKAQYPDARVEFIRYHSWWAEWRPYISGMTLDSFLQDIRQLFKYYKFTKKYPTSSKVLLSKDRNKALEFINQLNYDTVYVGSDTLLELFRCNQNEVSAYWLNSDVKARKFMIAASARDTSFASLSSVQKVLLNDSVSSFDMLGVRDDATFDLVSRFISDDDDRLRIVPDPTFALEIDYSYAEKYLERKGLLKTRKPIVCFHLLKNSMFAQELADLYREKGYLVASLRPAKYADFLLKDLSPMEFAGIFKYFDVVLTHRFHDSVFCLKNLCPLLLFQPSEYYENDKGNSKQSSLMEQFGLRQHCFMREVSSLTASDLFVLLEDAKKSFREKENSVANKLSELREQFKEYVSCTAIKVI